MATKAERSLEGRHYPPPSARLSKRVPPEDFGISTARTGGGKYVPTTSGSRPCKGCPSVLLEHLDGHAVRPGGTAVRLTCFHACHTSCFGMANGFPSCPDMLTRLLPGLRPGCSRKQVQMSRPLRSAPITGTSALLRAGPPARAATVLSASRFRPLGALPLAPATLRAQCQRAPSRVSARKPQTGLAPPARRAPPGQQYGYSARLIPGRALWPRFRCRFTLSTLQRWFTRVRLPGPRLTALTPPFPHRSPRQSSASAACGGLTPPPAGRRRRATKPSSCVQQAHRVIASYSGDSFPRTRRKMPWALGRIAPA